jgi:hypothetical protein
LHDFGSIIDHLIGVVSGCRIHSLPERDDCDDEEVTDYEADDESGYAESGGYDLDEWYYTVHCACSPASFASVV